MNSESMNEWCVTWAGRTVRVYDGPAYEEILRWDFPEDYFPWLCHTSDGLDFVSTDWRVTKTGRMEAIQVGASLDDLINSFIDVEDVGDDHEKAQNRRNIAIAALEKAVQLLKTKPLRYMSK